MTVLLFGGLVMGYPNVKIVLMNEKGANGNLSYMPHLTGKEREVMFANINAYVSNGMAFRVC